MTGYNQLIGIIHQVASPRLQLHVATDTMYISCLTLYYIHSSQLVNHLIMLIRLKYFDMLYILGFVYVISSLAFNGGGEVYSDLSINTCIPCLLYGIRRTKLVLSGIGVGLTGNRNSGGKYIFYKCHISNEMVPSTIH